MGVGGVLHIPKKVYINNMNLKRLVRIAVIALSLSVVAPIAPINQITIASAEACPMGWTTCGQYSIYDANGNQLNRVIGPTPMSAFIAYVRCRTANVNLCGDSSVVPLGYAVLDFEISSTPTPTPTASSTPTPTPTPTPTASSTPTPTPTASSTPTPTPTASSTPTPTATVTDNTYQNTCLPNGWTSCGLWIIYANSGSENNRIVGPSSLSALTATIGCQTSGVNLCMDNKGNPATGYALLSGTYELGKFISNSLPIVTRSPSPSPTPNPTSTTTDTKTATTTTDTKTATTTTATKTTPTATQSETRTAQVAVVTSISNTNERTVAAVELIKTFNTVEKEQSLNVTYKSTKSSVIDVDLVVPGIPVVITATKKGSPTITFKSTTDADGDAQIKTTKNLEGYSVVLTVNKTKIDTDVVQKKK
jgi:hypothetical protein